MNAFQFPRRLLFFALMSFALLTACNKTDDRTFQGYVEGDYLYLSAPFAGFLATLNVDRGSYVSAGTAVFAVAKEPQRYELSEAEAQMNSAQSKIANLQEPHRQQEIDAMEAELKTMQANLQYSESQLRRMQNLVKKNFVSRSELDQARSARDRDAAQVEAARQQLDVYRITFGRQPEIRSAEAELQAAEANVQQKRWQVDNKTISAPSQGEITETYYRPGEWVPAGQPVVSFLPDDRRRIRFFVQESDLAAIQPGQQIIADCDGCKEPVRAKITFISPQAEYTPPVIYSREARAKLVFRIEAEPPPADARKLHPGLPMDVRLLDGT